MSTQTQIYNQAFNFDVSFINADSSNNPQFLPLKYSAIEYLEIVDTINNVALSGYAIFDNYNDSLNSSPVFEFAKLYKNFFNFKFEQIYGPNASIAFDHTFVMNNIYTLPTSELGSKLCIQFDDVFFGTLCNKTVDSVSQVERYKKGRSSDVIKRIFEDYNQTNESIISENWADTSVDFDLQFSPSDTIGDIYDIAFLNNYTSTTGSPEDAIFNILKDDGDIFERTKTKYILEPINKRFLDLYSKLRGGAVSDLSDTVIEGIIESGAQPEDGRTGMIRGYSEVNEVQIIQPDPTKIRDMYRNIIVESVNEAGSSITDVIPISDSLSNFYRLFCNNPNYRLDIPITQDIAQSAELAKNAIKYTSYYPELEPGLTQAKLYNTILMNSKMMSFKIKGQAYRQPGFFIYFQPRRKSASNLNRQDNHYNKLVGFWYVVQVRHIFQGNAYDNIVTCVNPFTRNN